MTSFRLQRRIGIKRLTKPLDPMSELAKALEGHAAAPIDDDEPNARKRPLCGKQPPPVKPCSTGLPGSLPSCARISISARLRMK